MTRAERIVLAVATLAAAASRFVAIALTPWDWDEAQFMAALREFDVALHHPHPPGFPLFIGPAKLLVLAGVSPFRALQAIDVVAAIAIVPAMFFLAREARATFDVAVSAALILAFFPNVWFYGGTAFSDVPAMVLVVAAMALLLRGARSDAAFIGGAIVLAISAGFRPQNLVIGAVPFVIGAIRRPRTAVIAALVILAIVGVSYAVVVHLSEGWATFRETLQIHQQYITRTDSFRSPDRPALWRVFDDFFIRPYRAPVINTIVTIFVIVGAALALTGRRIGSLIVLLAFAPFCIFAWLILDRFSVSRFSIGYAPLMALLAAEGIFAIPWRRVASAMSAVLVTIMIAWTWPALRVVRTTPAPTAAAMQFIRDDNDPAKSIVEMQRLMTAFGDAMLPDYTRVPVENTLVPIVSFGSPRQTIFVREGASIVPGALTISRSPEYLWWLARQRYFAVTIVPVQKPQFGSGWYGEETDGAHVWRWMAQRGTVALPASIRPGRVTIRFSAPAGTSIAIGGAATDRITSTGAQIERTYEVRLPGELTIETDRIVNPARAGLSSDSRDLGLRLDSFELQLEVEPERHPGLHPLAAFHGR